MVSCPIKQPLRSDLHFSPNFRRQEKKGGHSVLLLIGGSADSSEFTRLLKQHGSDSKWSWKPFLRENDTRDLFNTIEKFSQENAMTTTHFCVVRTKRQVFWLWRQMTNEHDKKSWLSPKSCPHKIEHRHNKIRNTTIGYGWAQAV